MAREGEHRGGGFEWPDLATAVVSAVLTAVAVGVVLLPIYGALWPGGGEEGACSDRHAQDVLGGIGDSPVEARVHLVDGILECVWPAAGGGTHTLTYPVTVLDVHR